MAGLGLRTLPTTKLTFVTPRLLKLVKAFETIIVFPEILHEKLLTDIPMTLTDTHVTLEIVV